MLDELKRSATITASASPDGRSGMLVAGGSF
jgi:hypothetical protein